MKIRLLNLILIGMFCSCNSTPNKNTTFIEVDPTTIEALEKKAFEVYQKTPADAIPIFKQVATGYEKLKNFKKAGFTNLNIANIYDEHLNQLDSALIYAERSLEIWKSENESLQIANLYKYLGLLKGKKGQFEAAKSDLQVAIVIYNLRGFDQGLAVSEINLANVYYREKDYEKSITYFNRSKSFWLRQNDKGRIYTDNILGIKIFSAIKNDEKVDALIEENRRIEQEIDVNSLVKHTFEELINKIQKGGNR